MNILRRACVYTLTDRVHSSTVRVTLQIYAVEGRIYDYRSKWRNHNLTMDSIRWTEKVKNYHQMDEEMWDYREDDGRVVLQTERTNRSLPCRLR
jgi:ribosomal protein S3AE